MTKTPEQHDNAMEAVRNRVAKKLKGFTSDFPEDLDVMSSHRLPPKEFPVPELVLFALRNLMGWQWQGPGEKVRWTVCGSVSGEPVAFELRKLGFKILRANDPKIPESRIIGQLKSGLKEVERWLEPFAGAQVEEGNVSIANRFGEFENRYHFFRQLANKAFTAAKQGAPNWGSNTIPKLSDDLKYLFSNNREGFFYSTAMVDSYFSALEHRLVLLRAFTGKPLEQGELLSILSSKWEDKCKRILRSQEIERPHCFLGACDGSKSESEIHSRMAGSKMTADRYFSTFPRSYSRICLVTAIA